MEQDILSRAKNLALYRVSRKETSISDMSKYLEKKGTEASIVTAVLEYLRSLDLINDARYARLRSRALTQNGKGFVYIKQDLKRHGIQIDGEQYRAWTEDETGISEEEVAYKVAFSRYPDAHKDHKNYRRALSGILRRGFSYSIARSVLDRMKKRSLEDE